MLPGLKFRKQALDHVGRTGLVKHPSEVTPRTAPYGTSPTLLPWYRSELGSALRQASARLTYLHRPDGEQQVQLALPHHQRQEDGGFGQRQAGEFVSDIEVPHAAPGLLFHAASRSEQKAAPWDPQLQSAAAGSGGAAPPHGRTAATRRSRRTRAGPAGGSTHRRAGAAVDGVPPRPRRPLPAAVSLPAIPRNRQGARGLRAPLRAGQPRRAQGPPLPLQLTLPLRRRHPARPGPRSGLPPARRLPPRPVTDSQPIQSARGRLPAPHSDWRHALPWRPSERVVGESRVAGGARGATARGLPALGRESRWGQGRSGSGGAVVAWAASQGQREAGDSFLGPLSPGERRCQRPVALPPAGKSRNLWSVLALCLVEQCPQPALRGASAARHGVVRGSVWAAPPASIPPLACFKRQVTQQVTACSAGACGCTTTCLSKICRL